MLWALQALERGNEAEAAVIVFNLRCASAHVFEAWFRDGATYDRQAAAGEVVCPSCGATEVAKAPMAPRLQKAKGKDDAAAARRMRAALGELRDHVEKNCDYVGPGFAEEARKIHYGEIDKRNIYGEASSDEAEALKDEGVEFGRVPWLPRGES